MRRMKMFNVSRDQYADYIRRNADRLKDVPIEGAGVAVMQHINVGGRLMAQAIYNQGMTPAYQIRKKY